MIKKVLLFFLLFILTFVATYILLLSTNHPNTSNPASSKPVIIGFLPYWLLDKANKNYDQYFTDLAYFSVIVNPDGSIKKRNNPQETEPGWLALNNKDIKSAKILTVFNGDPDEINALIDNYASSAAKLNKELKPLGFSKINIDLESVAAASVAAQEKFTQFIKEFKNGGDWEISIDVSPTDLIEQRLINVTSIEPLVSTIILMTYDYHYSGSIVTGPVAPVGGFGVTAEYDVETAIKIALNTLPKGKIIVGVPLYGYEWESLNSDARAAILPGSGQVASNRRVATISAIFDPEAQENHAVFFDEDTKTYHQIFFPTEKSVQAKIDLVKKYDLAGLAFWAVGYDGDTILQPLVNYRQK